MSRAGTLQMHRERIDETPHGVVGGMWALDPRHERVGRTHSSRPGKHILVWTLDIEGRPIDCDRECVAAVEEARLL